MPDAIMRKRTEFHQRRFYLFEESGNDTIKLLILKVFSECRPAQYKITFTIIFF